MAKKKKQEEEVLEQQESTMEHDEQPQADSEADMEKNETTSVEDELAEMKDKYLRLYSEFENFRRRTAKERLDLIQTSTEGLMGSLLPVLDDYERAQEQMEKSEDITALKEGVALIHGKFRQILESKGLKSMESSVGQEFDAEVHEAITHAPAPSDDLKGKIMDEIEKGYKLQEKIIRFPKVIIGQ